MPIEANVTELNVAEALLQLHGGPCGPPTINNVPRLSPDNKMEIESVATLFLSCFTFTTPHTPSTSAALVSPAMNNPSRYSISSQDDNSEVNSQSSLDSPMAYRGNKMIHKSSTKYRHVEPKNNSRQAKQLPKTKRTPQRRTFNENRSNSEPMDLSQKTTRDQGTQTERESVNRTLTLPEIAEVDEIVKNLYARVRSLEKQLRAVQATPSPPFTEELTPAVSSDVLRIQRCTETNNSYNNKKSKKRSPSILNSTGASTRDTEVPDDEWRPEEHKPSKQSFRETLHSKGTDLVPIGEGYAMVPKRLLKQIDWSSYTGATRKLLTAVFSRRVLATHSLTGKPSPAFPGKPAKKRLEPELVNDIVQIVVERCGVPESVVRTSITTKCADESKMYRSRQQMKNSECNKNNQENVPPLPTSPYDSSDE